MKKKILSIMMAFMMTLGMHLSASSNVFAAIDISKPGQYIVPIRSVISEDILPELQQDFEHVFGENVEVMTDEHGQQVLTLNLNHMVIDIHGKKFHANIQTIEEGIVVETAKEVYSVAVSKPDSYQSHDVAKLVELPLRLNREGKQKFKVTVDALENGKPLSTVVTLALDVDQAKNAQQSYSLADGNYSVPVKVLERYDDIKAVYNDAIKDATVQADHGVLTVTLNLQPFSVNNSRHYIDQMTYELEDGSYQKAKKTAFDSEGHVTQLQFTLAKNTKLTNVRFFYSNTISEADSRLLLGLDEVKLVDGHKNYFDKDGTYRVNVALWHEINDEVSFANSALVKEAKIIVKDGKATMYIDTQKMKNTASYLHKLYLGTLKDDYRSSALNIISYDKENHPVTWSLALPHENEFIDVVFNINETTTGNKDMAARIKVDYSTLTYVSAETDDKETAFHIESHDLENVQATDKDKQNRVRVQNNETLSKQDKPIESKQVSAEPLENNVKTGDNSKVEVFAGLLILSALGFIVINKDKIYKKYF